MRDGDSLQGFIVFVSSDFSLQLSLSVIVAAPPPSHPIMPPVNALWLGGVMVKALTCNRTGREFDSRLGR